MNPKILPLGDRALLVNFEQKIAPDIHRQVMHLASGIRQAGIDGVTFIHPCYCSITLGYDPKKIRYLQLKSKVLALKQEPVPESSGIGRKITLPVCYQEPHALDLAAISKLSGLTNEKIIEIHTDQYYLVYMMGFLPGFPYLGVLPDSLRFARKPVPRKIVPERSVGLAGLQTGIYPFDSPGGWNIIGRTPLPLFNSHSESPFLMSVGDRLKFRSIDHNEYAYIESEVQRGIFDWNKLYEPAT